ncbi:hypothetical protein [Synechocystis salina]|nr:hypothetical protein [Synechocystis salina]
MSDFSLMLIYLPKSIRRRLVNTLPSLALAIAWPVHGISLRNVRPGATMA